MKVKYKWKSSGRMKIKPEIAARELERIRKAHGTLKPEDVVEVASEPSHPLHSCFEWDDTKAAHLHRIAQAGHMIRVLVVVRADDDSEEPIMVRAYAHMKDEDEEGETQCHYINVVQGMCDPVMRDRILAQAIKELATFRKKYADLREFAAVFAAMDKIAV